MKTTLIVLLGSLFSYFIPHLLNLNMWSSCQLTIDNWACLIFMWAEDTNIVDSVYIFLVSIFVVNFCNLFASLGILSFSSECIGWVAHEPWHHIGSQVVHCYPKYVSDNGVNLFVFVLIQQEFHYLCDLMSAWWGKQINLCSDKSFHSLYEEWQNCESRSFKALSVQQGHVFDQNELQW